MSQSSVLAAEKRTELGSRTSRALRGEQRIPANIQGGDAHIDISIDEHAFLAARRAHVHLYDIDVDGQVEAAVVRELQWDTFGDRIIHVEFQKVIRGVAMESEVEMEFLGAPKGVLNHLLTHITISCIPSMIPNSLPIKIEGLEEGAHIRASDIELPEGVELAVPTDTEIATIVSARAKIAVDEDEDGEGEGEGEGEATTEPTPDA